MDPIVVVRMVAASQSGVITATQCRQAGFGEGRVRTMCRDRRWLRLGEGVYFVDADRLDGEPPRAALIRAALFGAGTPAVAVLSTAAELHGIAGLPQDPVVHVSVPGQLAKPRPYEQTGVAVHQLVLRPDETTVVSGVPVTTATRTVADVILRVDRLTAVSVLDSALNRRILVPEELDLVRSLIHGRRGAAVARPCLSEVDGRAESPLETRVRLRATDGNLPPDELQYRVHNAAGEIIAIGDLAWLRSRTRIIGEADGFDSHDNPTAIFRDRHRQNDIVAAGFVPIRFTWADTLDPSFIPHTIRMALRRAA